MDNLFAGIPLFIVYLDNILVLGTSQEDHLRNLELVLQKLQSADLCLKKNKCEFRVPSIFYLGYKIDAEGLHPLPDKVEAITKAATPTSTTELKAFLGLLNYYGKFIPNLSSLLSLLYKLLYASVEWEWTKEREEAFKAAKSMLTSESAVACG